MTDKLFKKLWTDALEQPNKDLYVAEYGYPEWFDEISDDIETVKKTLENIHKVAHISIAELVSMVGTQSAFADKFCISVRTVQNWTINRRNCPDYLRLLFARELGLI